MPRNLGVTIENNFVKGLITEATGLNFPENSCIDTDNCVFDKTGEVSRRPGIEFEDSHVIFATETDDVAISEYVWRGAAKNGENTFFVVQVGNIISFFRADIEGNVSGNEEAFFVSLASFNAGGAPSLSDTPCSFAAGNGLLFIAHPYCEPIVVEYDETTRTITSEAIDIKIRDMFGVANKNIAGVTLPVNKRVGPEELTPNIRYNLYNQGWYGQSVVSRENKWYFSQPTLLFFVNSTGLYPSEAEISWLYKAPLIPILDDDGNIISGTPKESISSLEFGEFKKFGNTPAPKGHYILDAFYQDRDAATVGTTGHTTSQGIPEPPVVGVPVVTSGYQRPSQIAFYAGRVFYAGVSAPGFSTKVYFSQILEGKKNLEKCYQLQDPTSEEGGDLLPSDGGWIEIPEMAKVVKMMAFGNSILMFATNGVWMISGSEGIGFTAVDYNVTRLSSIGALGPHSFVDVDGTPLWWNHDGIYTIKQQVAGAQPTVESISANTIDSFYQDIPAPSKRYAKGAYNSFTRIVQWIYRSEEEDGISNRYAYDRILNLDVSTGAFYPWSLPDECVKISGITVLLGNGVSFIADDVTVEGETVTVNGEPVTANEIFRSELQNVFKYLVTTTCDNEEIPDAELSDYLTIEPDFKGHSTEITSALESAYKIPHQNSIIIGGDNKMYVPTIPQNSSDGAVILIRFDSTDEDQLTLPLATLQSDISSVGLGVSFVPVINRFCVPVPFTKYFYVSIGGHVDFGISRHYYSCWALYEVTAGGAIQFHAAQRYEGSGFALNYAAIIVPHAVDYQGVKQADPLSQKLYIAISNLSAAVYLGSAGVVLDWPSVNSFIAGNGTDSLWADMVVPTFGQNWTYFYRTGSNQPDDFANPASAFFLPLDATSSMICLYVSKALASYHNENPGASGNDPTIATYSAAYPTGFVLGVRLDTGGGMILNSNLKDEDGGPLIPFSDLGLNRDGSAGDDDYNDWANPTVQGNATDGTAYIIWSRRYEPGATNYAPYGNYTKVKIQRWTPSSLTAITIAENEGPLWDTVAEGIAHVEAVRYSQYPVTILSFMVGTTVYQYVQSDSTTATNLEFIVGQVGQFIEPEIVVSEAGLTFAEFNNLSYLDWEASTGGVDFTSFFIPGYKVRGEAIRKFQSNYVQLWTRNEVPSKFDFSSQWDFANSNITGRWSQVQRIDMDDGRASYDYKTKRLKVRGHGKALTYKVVSVSRQPFNIIGWSVLESANATP